MSKFECTVIDYSTAGNVLANNQLNRYFINEGFRKNSVLMKYIEKTREGSVVFTCGSGRYNLLLVGGVHGNELPSQAALVHLMEALINDEIKIKCKLNVIPFLIPYTTMNNSRNYNDKDMNRNAHLDGITKKIVDFAQNNSVTALCDCHSTDPDNKPGLSSVFCSARPLLDSVKIANHICFNTASRILPVTDAGSILHGAVEDESNIRGIPAVTCETVEKSGQISSESVKFSYSQIMSFLDYFGVIG